MHPIASRKFWLIKHVRKCIVAVWGAAALMAIPNCLAQVSIPPFYPIRHPIELTTAFQANYVYITTGHEDVRVFRELLLQLRHSAGMRRPQLPVERRPHGAARLPPGHHVRASLPHHGVLLLQRHRGAVAEQQGSAADVTPDTTVQVCISCCRERLKPIDSIINLSSARILPLFCSEAGTSVSEDERTQLRISVAPTATMTSASGGAKPDEKIQVTVKI